MDHRTVNIHDLGLAAALVTYEHELIRTENDARGRTYFVFARSHGLVDTINRYWSDTLNLHARRFFDNTKMLKNRIYAEK